MARRNRGSADGAIALTIMAVEACLPGAGWEHFGHGADIGVRGIGPTKAAAFEQAALALTAVVTDVDRVRPTVTVAVACEAPADDLLFVDWLNALVYEMATRRMLFSAFDVSIDGSRLSATARGEGVDRVRHEPAVEIKGATYTALRVEPLDDGRWLAQCVVDV
jgi:tRNA nucleotidyltransferase (CCA-adding enzyme)